jgi:hypothetical protein
MLFIIFERGIQKLKKQVQTTGGKLSNQTRQNQVWANVQGDKSTDSVQHVLDGKNL